MERNLKLLMIDDRKTEIHKPHIDLVECTTVSGLGSTNKLWGWTQHMSWYLQDSVPEFDLLFVDINFIDDGTAPSYPGQGFNPYGLLHALPIAARQHRSGLPFAWVIGTAYAKDVQRDAIAIFAYGLLRSMERTGEQVPYEVLEKGAPAAEFFSKQIARLQSLDRVAYFHELLKRYRAQLALAGKNTRVSFDLNELGDHLLLASKADSRSMRDLLNLPLTVYHAVGMVELRLRSIFADYAERKEEDQEFVLAVKTFLENLKKIAEEADIFPDVERAMLELDSNTRLSLNAIVNSRNPRSRLIKIAVVICMWLKLYADIESQKGARNPENVRAKVKASDLTSELGLDQNRVQEILHNGGYSCTLSTFMHILASEPLESPALYSCVERLWNRMHKPKGLPLPGCLLQPDGGNSERSIG